MGEAKRIARLRVSALVEIAIFLAFMLLLDYAASDGTRFWDVSPHPYWIIVLLVAVQYGTPEGLTTALTASLMLLTKIPAQDVTQDMYAYLLSIAANPLMWLVTAVVLGELRRKHLREREHLRQELAQARAREEKIAQSYEWVKEIKEKMELRIAGQLRSQIAAYHAAKAMESLSPQEVVQGLEELVKAVMNPEKFSVFLLEKPGLEATVTYGWKEKDTYPRHYDARSDLYRAIIAGKQVLCAVNPEQEYLLAGQGILAASLIDKATGELVGMLKIEKLGFTDLNLSSIETFASLGEWGGMALANARRYQTAKSGSVINPDHNLMTYGYFQRCTDYIAALARRVGFDVSMVVVHLANPERHDETTRARLARVLADTVDGVLRDVDLAFDYQQHSKQYSIVLPATARPGAEIVVNKIRSALTDAAKRVARNANFSFTVQAIHEK
jgi:hypothetical protein